jgi:hypothetical protein
LRKYLIVAIAALTAIAFTAVAVAQNDAADLKVTLTPKKAGTKKKPKSVKFILHAENKDTKRTLASLDITMPKTVKISGKGFKTCSASTLDNSGPAACPKGSKVGSGSAKAILGVTNPATAQPLTFKVTAFVGGAKKINLFLQGLVNVTSPGTVIKGGKVLHIVVPDSAQQPVPGTYAGLVSLDTTIGAKKGKHILVATTGCKKHKQPFKLALNFINNGISPAGTVNASANAACK